MALACSWLKTKGSGRWSAAGYFLKATSRMAPPESVKATSTKLLERVTTDASEFSDCTVVNVARSEVAAAAGGRPSFAICLLTSLRISDGAGRCGAYFWLYMSTPKAATKSRVPRMVFFLSKRRESYRRVCGTGSWPPSWRGVHFMIRRAASHPPRIVPCDARASMA